ncbi:MAG: carbon-nitrogen hydrolase family protein [Deltaproteobacteria bacterium]|nr:carbon-nitrogen hydrolase family protein [Deltaproteobacteria bacterium]
MTPLCVAGLQLALDAHADNSERIAARIAHTVAHYPFVRLVLVSELATFGASPRFAQPLPGSVEASYAALAREHGIWLIPGTLFEQADDGRVYNTASVIDPSGAVVARYRKLFPFRPYEEGVEAGDACCVFDVPQLGRVGLSICYDLWFPETTRTLAAMGAEVILHPVMTTTIDRDVEIAMTRAMAAMNQCFIVSVNGAGAGGNGRSVVCGPTGDLLVHAGETEQIIPIELDLDVVRRGRELGLWGLGQPLKSFRDRKIDFSVYRKGAPGFDALHALGPLRKQTRED